jgi:TonB family protein
VRYCYEVELQRNQNLEGRVMMTWVIGATGAVAKVVVKETTLNNAGVEECLRSKIMTWKFPPPAGGGVVEVNYPFVFKAT